MPGYLDKPVPRGRDPVFRTRPVSIIRKGRWKLHLYLEEWLLDGGSNAMELYDLENDMGEHHNLAQQHPEVCEALLAELESWMKQSQAPVPTKKNPAYDPSAKTKQTGSSTK
jgi:arylsulfatase A-like enzyme